MALSIFIDALPYNEIKNDYCDYFECGQLSKLYPNIAYSSTLHWQLYCDKYPDDRGKLVDWEYKSETRRIVRFISFLLSPLDHFPRFALFIKKILDRVFFRKNMFANVPFRFRSMFSETGEYLFWDKRVYGEEHIFNGYSVVSQDEGHISFEETLSKLNLEIDSGNKNIMAVFGFADAIGHKFGRNEEYSEEIRRNLKKLKILIDNYHRLHPEQEVITISDHGMSTVTKIVDIPLEKEFGKQSKKSYIVYSDSAMMCIWIKDDELKTKIVEFLSKKSEGHVLTEDERAYYRVSDKKFGDVLFNLREGCVFKTSWFGQGIKPIKLNSYGMHGFWPEQHECDQTASVILQYSDRILEDEYNYRKVHHLIKDVMQKGSNDAIFLQK